MPLTAMLGIAFLLLALAAGFLMMRLWGYPYDEATHTSAAPKSLILLHRLLGYVFAVIYVVMMWKMVPRLWNYAGELPTRSVLHAMLGFGIGILLVVKVAILRGFPAFRKYVPLLGMSIMGGTVLMLALPLSMVGWEWSLSRRAGDSAARERVRSGLLGLGGVEAERAPFLALPESIALGRATLWNRCTQCHDIRTVLQRPRSAAEWRSTVRTMAVRSRDRRQIGPEEELLVTAYLIAARGRDGDPPRISVVPPTPAIPEAARAPATPAAETTAPPSTSPAAASPSEETAPSQSVAVPTAAPVVESTVRPAASAVNHSAVGTILATRCAHCHAGGSAPRGLSLESVEHLLAGGSSGAVVVAGDPAASEIIRRVRGESVPRMPLDGPPFLSDEEIIVMENWVRALGGGAPTTEATPTAIPSTAASTAQPTAGSMATRAATPMAAAPTAAAEPRPGEPVTWAHVRTIFGQNCARCHAPQGILGGPPEGLILTQWEMVFRTPERPVVIPGNPDASPLLRHVTGQESPRMPFDGPPYLNDGQISLIHRWIADGARDENGSPGPSPAGREVRLEGTLTAQWAVDGTPFRVSGGTEVRDARVGSRVEVRATVQSDGSLLAHRVRGR